MPMDVYVHSCAVKLPRWRGLAKAAKEKLAAMVPGAHLPTSTASGSRGTDLRGESRGARAGV